MRPFPFCVSEYQYWALAFISHPKPPKAMGAAA
jgi:hypothetical protein